MHPVMIEVPEGYVIDEVNSSFTCIKFKKEEKKEAATCWEDLNFIEGFYINSNAIVHELDAIKPEDNNRNIFATKEQAEASIALAMLSQLMKNVNGDWIPDWNDNTDKYVIGFSGDSIRTDYYVNYTSFLVFPLSKIRDTFLKHHKDLILKAKPLL